MTTEERREALSIISKYQKVNNRIERLLESLQRLTDKKDLAMNELEQLKQKEISFISRYREKYGDTNQLIAELQKGTR